MVLKRPCFGDTRKKSVVHILCSRLQETGLQLFSWETELWAIFPGNISFQWYDSFSGKMVLKRPFVGDPGKDSATHFFVQVSWGIEHQAILLEDRTLSWFDSFSGKMVLQRLFVGDTGEDFGSAHSFFRSKGDLALSLSGKQGWVFLLWDKSLSQYDSFSDKIVLKIPCVSDTTGDSALHVHCSSLGEESAFSHSPESKRFELFLGETELWVDCDSFIGKKVLKKAICWWSWDRLDSAGSLFRSPGDRAISWYNSFSGKMVLKIPCISDTGKASAHLIRSSERQSICWETKLNKSIGL